VLGRKQGTSARTGGAQNLIFLLFNEKLCGTQLRLKLVDGAIGLARWGSRLDWPGSRRPALKWRRWLPFRWGLRLPRLRPEYLVDLVVLFPQQTDLLLKATNRHL